MEGPPIDHQTEETPGIGPIIDKLAPYAEAERSMETLWQELDSRRDAYYDAMREPLADGATFDVAKQEAAGAESSYRDIQAEAADTWIAQNEAIVAGGLDNLVSFSTTHPDWMHPDVAESGISPADLESFFHTLPSGIVVPVSGVRRYSHAGARQFLDFAAVPAHFAEAASPIGQMVAKTTNMLSRVAYGAWYGPTEAINRTSLQLSQQGCEVLWKGLPNFDDVLISGIHHVGFVPRMMANDGKVTIDQPILPVVII